MIEQADIQLMNGDALIIVDVQNDFLPGGSLPVPDGNRVVSILNRYIGIFESSRLPIFASRDWHPVDHCSFRDQGGIWPPHCMAGSEGAEFASELRLPVNTRVVSKATAREQKGYSCFEETELTETLHANGIRRLFIGGLATDYCVLNSVKDALKKNFSVFLLEDAIQAVNIRPDNGCKAKDEMQNLGCKFVTLEDLLR